jgi:hypothetical protein
MRELVGRLRATSWRACRESVGDRIHRDAAQVRAGAPQPGG